MAKNPLNILIVCEHASNAFGGEAMLPLNYFRLLSDTGHNVYLITHERVRKSIETIPGVNKDAIYYLPDTKLHIFLNKYAKLLPDRIAVATFGFVMHLITQYYQRKVAKRVIRDKKIDLVHEPAPVSATQPSAMFALGVPVIIGPMNGGMSFPESFKHMASGVERVTYRLIKVAATIFNLLIPGKFFADILLVANQRTANALPKFRCGQIKQLVENGVFSVKKELTVSNKTEDLNVLYVGRLVDWKCVDIVIDASARTSLKVKLQIVGDGNERFQLEEYVRTKKYDHVEFVGMVAHSEIDHYYDQADIFVLPSVRECGGAVVLEAMSRGLPVIATDWGGPADYITAETGFLVEPHSKEYMVNEFAKIIDLLSASPELRYKVGLAAMNRVEQNFTWDEKIQAIINYYQSVI